MKKTISLLLVLALMFAVVLTGCTPKPADNPAPAASTEPAASTAPADASKGLKAEDVKVGFIYVGPIGDGGWTFAHNEGRKFLEQQIPGIKTIYQESVPEGQEVEKVMTAMIDQGCQLIFTTSFGYMDYTEKVAKEHPEVKFMHCSGYKSTDNMGNYFGRMYQPRYLSGIAAGLKTKTNKVGFVGAFEIPEVIGGIDAFTLGVRSVNPKAVVKVRWTHTWYDPAKEKEAAKSLLDEGCDVIAQHQDTAGPQQAAEEKGVWSIGYNTDMKNAAPKAYLTAPIWNWGPFYTDQVKKLMDGTWKPEAAYLGMKEGMVDLAPLTANNAPEAQAAIDKAKAGILDGTLKVYGGPIKDQTGKVRVEQGKELTDQEILSIDWFVEGVEGKTK